MTLSSKKHWRSISSILCASFMAVASAKLTNPQLSLQNLTFLRQSELFRRKLPTSCAAIRCRILWDMKTFLSDDSYLQKMIPFTITNLNLNKLNVQKQNHVNFPLFVFGAKTGFSKFKEIYLTFVTLNSKRHWRSISSILCASFMTVASALQPLARCN